MLPPEVENLHRVIHQLEVMKNSLLSSPTGCEKYFAGVGQLEADLGHYKGLLAKQQKKRKKGRRKQPEGRLRAITVGSEPSGEPPRSARSRPALSAMGF